MAIDTKKKLSEHVLEAYEWGFNIDLDGCVYGPATGATTKGYIDETMSYYRLLAGHCLLTRALTVVEIGTHYGGSTLAFLFGMRAGGADDPLLLTMDITDLNRARLEAEPEIVKIIGDSTYRGFMSSAAMDLKGRDVDILYIDALKDPGYVLRTMYNAHSVGMRPTWLILDDINTNDGMRALWDVLEAEAPEAALQISHQYPQIRRPEMGYGIVHLAQTDDPMARCEEFMERLGIDRSSLWKEADTRRLAKAVDAGKGEAYASRATDTDFDEGSAADLARCYDLARDVYAGRGDIVEFGGFTGPTTRALARGLADNADVAHKFARITTIDTFRYTMPGEDRAVAGRVSLGASVLPILFDTLGGHLEKVNVIESAPNTVRWCGRPIELLVLNAMRTPQITANVIHEFLPHLLVGESLVLHRELIRPYRLATSWIFAFLRGHFEVVQYERGMALLKYVRPVDADAQMKIIENRFVPEERATLVEDWAEEAKNSHLAWDLGAQAARLHIATGNLDAASVRLDVLQCGVKGSLALTRQKTVHQLAEQIKKEQPLCR